MDALTIIEIERMRTFGFFSELPVTDRQSEFAEEGVAFLHSPCINRDSDRKIAVAVSAQNNFEVRERLEEYLSWGGGLIWVKNARTGNITLEVAQAGVFNGGTPFLFGATGGPLLPGLKIRKTPL